MVAWHSSRRDARKVPSDPTIALLSVEKEVGVEATEHTCVHSTGFEVPICQ
jgi:hypothetical protein